MRQKFARYNLLFNPDSDNDNDDDEDDDDEHD